MTKRKIFLLVGLGYGDEGKGTITDYLSSCYPVTTICRYNGGAQAAHHVVSDKGTVHCFSQFGSGLLSAKIKTYLSEFMLVNPINLFNEYNVLEPKVRFKIPKTYIDAKALIITPYHVLANQMREISRGSKRYGSCGKGVGETISDAKKYGDEVLRAKDLGDFLNLKCKLRFLQALKIDVGEQLLDSDPTNAELLSLLKKMRSEAEFQNLLNFYFDFSTWLQVKIIKSSEVIYDSDLIFEGAQGSLLHRDYGFYPHLTQSDTSFANAEAVIKKQNLSGEIFKIGVLRAYATRHGAGPFVTYDSKLSDLIPDEHNLANQWQGNLNVGWLDLVATKYALKIVGELDGLALTNLDRLQDLAEIKVCTSYQYLGSTEQKTLEQFFECECDGLSSQLLIKEIKLTPADKFSDLVYRQQITSILNDCWPIYETLQVRRDNFVDDYVQHLEAALKTKVLLISTGPRTSDKKMLKTLG